MNATPALMLPETVPVWYLFASILATLFGGGLVGGIVTGLGLWMNKGKPEAEIHESHARAARDFAEADEIRIRATLSLEDETLSRTRQMLRAQSMIFQLQEENRLLKAENDSLRDRKQMGA